MIHVILYCAHAKPIGPSIAYDFSRVEYKIDEQLIGKPLSALTSLLQMVHEDLNCHLLELPADLQKKSGSFVIALFCRISGIRNITVVHAAVLIKLNCWTCMGLQLQSLAAVHLIYCPPFLL
jgi:hypothetical protein